MLTRSLTLGQEAGNAHFMYTLSSLLHYPLFTQRMRHFQCLWLVWSNFYLKCWGTVSSRARGVEEKGRFSPEGSMKQKCPRGKTSTWTTILCCTVTVPNVTIGCSRLLLIYIWRVNLDNFKVFRAFVILERQAKENSWEYYAVRVSAE